MSVIRGHFRGQSQPRVHRGLAAHAKAALGEIRVLQAMSGVLALGLGDLCWLRGGSSSAGRVAQSGVGSAGSAALGWA
jgi:hypothetical protein